MDRMLKLDPDHEEGLVLKGWVELAAGKESRARNHMEYFDAVLQRLNLSLFPHGLYILLIFCLLYI